MVVGCRSGIGAKLKLLDAVRFLGPENANQGAPISQLSSHPTYLLTTWPGPEVSHTRDTALKSPICSLRILITCWPTRAAHIRLHPSFSLLLFFLFPLPDSSRMLVARATCLSLPFRGADGVVAVPLVTDQQGTRGFSERKCRSVVNLDAGCAVPASFHFAIYIFFFEIMALFEVKRLVFFVMATCPAGRTTSDSPWPSLLELHVQLAHCDVPVVCETGLGNAAEAAELAVEIEQRWTLYLTNALS